MAIRKSAAVLLTTEIKARWKENDSFLKLFKKFEYWYPAEVKQLVR